MPGTPRTFVGAAMFLLDRPVCRHLEAVVTAELERIPGLAVVDLNPRTGSLIVRAGEPVDR
ncbi:MAG TPA: hypothetical protein PLD37_14195, partial [Usitatibacteraceae bacterium]|nr:hypothetical protein [Usitatibacteraceae bacterium]